jgi:hypothetical protein
MKLAVIEIDRDEPAATNTRVVLNTGSTNTMTVGAIVGTRVGESEKVGPRVGETVGIAVGLIE